MLTFVPLLMLVTTPVTATVGDVEAPVTVILAPAFRLITVTVTPTIGFVAVPVITT